MPLKVFVDFDGTITNEDVCNAFFARFGGSSCEAIVRQYRNGTIGATECFRRKIEAVGLLRDDEAKSFFRGQKIDESFKDFVAFCRMHNIEFHVVSDGLDYYIEEILRSYSLEGISYFSNHIDVQFEAGSGWSRLSTSFPYTDAECTRCACCKRNIMLTQSGEEDIIVYVGNLDPCPAQYADVVFARESLQRFCQKENISFYSYTTFADVVQRFEMLLAKKTLRTRRRAELRRQEVFIGE